jgi:hypothetical protein
MPKVLLFKTTKKQSITFTLNDSNIIEVKHCIDDGSLNGVTETWCLLSEHQKAISKLPFSFNALIAFAESNQIPPATTTDNKTVATGEQVGVVDSVGDALSFVLPVQNKVLENVSFVRLEHDVIATWNAYERVAFYKFPIEYFKCLEDLKNWHKFIRFIKDKATDVSQAETIKHFVRSVLYPQNSLTCQDFDDINDALLCAMRSMPHRFNEFQAIQSKILSVFPFLPEYSDTVLDDDIPPIFAESGIFDKAD